MSTCSNKMFSEELMLATGGRVCELNFRFRTRRPRALAKLRPRATKRVPIRFVLPWIVTGSLSVPESWKPT